MLYFSIKIHVYTKIRIGPHLGVNAAQTDVAKKEATEGGPVKFISSCTNKIHIFDI